MAAQITVEILMEFGTHNQSTVQKSLLQFLRLGPLSSVARPAEQSWTLCDWILLATTCLGHPWVQRTQSNFNCIALFIFLGNKTNCAPIYSTHIYPHRRSTRAQMSMSVFMKMLKSQFPVLCLPEDGKQDVRSLDRRYVVSVYWPPLSRTSIMNWGAGF